MQGKVVLERALSKLGLASRAQTRQWILEGRLSVNGKIIKDPSLLVVPENSRFALDGNVFSVKEEAIVLLHKTKGVVTTRSDEKGRPTIYSLLPERLHHLHAVGRLDLHTTGLLVLTSNSKFSSYLTNPENKIHRIYLVTVRGEMTQADVDLLLKGIEDKGEILRAKEILIRKTSHRESHVTVTLVQGKNREVRRMFSSIHHEVTSLKRIAFGSFELGDLPLGQWKELSLQEVQKTFFSFGVKG